MLIPRGISFEMCALFDWSMRPLRIRLELPRKTHIVWRPVREAGSGVWCVCVWLRDHASHCWAFLISCVAMLGSAFNLITCRKRQIFKQHWKLRMRHVAQAPPTKPRRTNPLGSTSRMRDREWWLQEGREKGQMSVGCVVGVGWQMCWRSVQYTMGPAHTTLTRTHIRTDKAHADTHIDTEAQL